MEWSEEKTALGSAPVATLRDGSKIIVKVYLSPDALSIRFVLPEFIETTQVSFKPGGIIDFRRK